MHLALCQQGYNEHVHATFHKLKGYDCCPQFQGYTIYGIPGYVESSNQVTVKPHSAQGVCLVDGDALCSLTSCSAPAPSRCIIGLLGEPLPIASYFGYVRLIVLCPANQRRPTGRCPR